MEESDPNWFVALVVMLALTASASAQQSKEQNRPHRYQEGSGQNVSPNQEQETQQDRLTTPCQ